MKLKVGDFFILKSKYIIYMALVTKYWEKDDCYDITVLASNRYPNTKTQAYTYKDEMVYEWELEKEGWKKFEV